jgi:hypothetical protein
MMDAESSLNIPHHSAFEMYVWNIVIHLDTHQNLILFNLPFWQNEWLDTYDYDDVLLLFLRE